MAKSRRVTACLLFVSALCLSTLGQYYFFYRRAYLWDGVVFYAIGISCFLTAWRLSTPRRTSRVLRLSLPLGTWLAAMPVSATLMVFGLLLSFCAGLLSPGRGAQEASGDISILWALGTGGVILAALWPLSWPNALSRSRLRLHTLNQVISAEAVILAALVVLAFTLRSAALNQIPYVLSGDEGWHGLLARQVGQGELRNPFTMSYMSMPTFFYWPLSWTLRLAGDGMVGLRLLAAVAGTVTIPLFYAFVRSRWGLRTAVLAALFLAMYDYHIHYSRLGIQNIWDPLFVLLTLWEIDSGLKSEDWIAGTRHFILAGSVMGLSVYFYTGARILPIFVFIYVAFWCLRKRSISSRLLLSIILLFLAFLVVGAPMLAFAMASPGTWNARINQVGILQSGWLELAQEMTGRSVPSLLAEQFVRAAGAFNVFPDRTVWYGADRPLLSFGAGVLALLGMIWIARRWREPRNFSILTWFWVTIIVGGMLTESPPSSQRLIIVAPAVALLVALGLEQAVTLINYVLKLRPIAVKALLATAILALSVESVRYYFVELHGASPYGGENAKAATAIGYYLSDLEGETTAYLFGAPRLYWNSGTFEFLVPDVVGYDIAEPIEETPELTQETQRIVFLFLPERLEELAIIQESLPNGDLLEFHDDGGHVYAVAYQIERGSSK